MPLKGHFDTKDLDKDFDEEVFTYVGARGETVGDVMEFFKQYGIRMDMESGRVYEQFKNKNPELSKTLLVHFGRVLNLNEECDIGGKDFHIPVKFLFELLRHKKNANDVKRMGVDGLDQIWKKLVSEK